MFGERSGIVVAGGFAASYSLVITDGFCTADD
jgi:hypothetical protein